MAKPQMKRYGRVEPNLLDKLLSAVVVVIALGAIWTSIGVSIANIAPTAANAFTTFSYGLGFVLNAGAHGQSAVISAIVCVIFYASLLLLVIGSLAMSRRKHGDRIPGLVAEFVAALGLGIFLCLFHELRQSTALAGFWTVGIAVFAALLGVCVVCSTYLAFTFPVDEPEKVAVKEEESEKAVTVKEPEPVVEEEKEPEEETASEPIPVEPVPEEEQPKEEQEKEPEPEPIKEEEPADVTPVSVVTEAPAEEEGDYFSSLGKRRKRIPFENMIKRADKETRERYKAIVSALREYDFNDRKSIPGETFSYKRTKLVFITISGKTLKVHFALDPKQFENDPMPIKDASDVKKFEELPSYLKVRSDLAVRRVIMLAERLAKEHNVPKK